MTRLKVAICAARVLVWINRHFTSHVYQLLYEIQAYYKSRFKSRMKWKKINKTLAEIAKKYCSLVYEMAKSHNVEI